MNNQLKRCCTCKQDKPTHEFSKNKNTYDRLQARCRSCNKEYMKLWKLQNPQKYTIWLHNTDKGKLQKERNRKKYKESGNKRKDERARKLRIQIQGSFTKEEFETIKQAYGNICLCCGSNDNIHADHVIALAKGGLNDITNIQPLCSMCNSIKHTKHIDFRMFWMLFCKIFSF